MQRIHSGNIGRAVVNFAAKDRVHGASMSRYRLVWVEVYSEFSIELLDSGAVPKFMYQKMLKKPHFSMQPTNCSIKAENSASERCVGTLNEVLVSLGEFAVPLDFFDTGEDPYDIFNGLSTMIQLRERPDYYRMALKIY